MSLVGQHFLAGFDGLSVTAVVRDLILKERVLGFTLFKWNIESAEQLRGLTGELKALARQAGYDILLAVDQEGGRVERLPEPFNRVPSMRRWAEACRKEGSDEPMAELGRILGREVRLAGFNLDFAPVVDVDLNAMSPIIGDRSFSSDAGVVTRHARAVIRGLLGEGVIPCLKHFPGHGATSKDSHLELPVDGRPREDILATDVLPYRALMAEGLVPALMTAHVLYPGIDPNHPGTLSEKIVANLLREGLRYDGVVFSDDLLMKAIADHFDLADVCERFFLIGGDAVLVCKDPELAQDLIRKTRAKTLSADGVELATKLNRALMRLDALKSRFLPRFYSEDAPLAEAVQKHKAYVDGLFNTA
jgi:beta-N-acetylhexosaminidase